MGIKEITTEQFNEFAENFNGNSIYQTSPYAFVMNNQKLQTMFLGLVDDNKIIGATLLIIQKHQGFKKAYAPRGFLLDYTNVSLIRIFTDEMKRYLGKLDVISVRLNPLVTKKIYNNSFEPIKINPSYNTIFNNIIAMDYHHLGYNYNFESLKPRYEAILDISENYIDLFKNIKKEYRTKIRSAEKYGIRVYKGNIDDLDNLYFQTQKKYPRDLKYFQDCYKYYGKKQMIDFYYTKLDTNKFLTCTKDLYEKELNSNERINEKLLHYPSNKKSHLVNQKINSDKLLNKYKNQLVYATKLSNEYQEGIITSSCLIVKNKNEIYVLIDGYDLKYKGLNSKHLLFWKLIEKYSKLGYKKFNFGGITDLNKGLEKYKGLNEFKLNFNPSIYEYIGDFELITNQTLYFIYRRNYSLTKILQK